MSKDGLRINIIPRFGESKDEAINRVTTECGALAEDVFPVGTRLSNNNKRKGKLKP